LGGRHGAGTSSQKQFIILVSFTSVAISAQVFPPPLAYGSQAKTGEWAAQTRESNESEWVQGQVKLGWDNQGCRAAAIKNNGIRVLSVGCKVKDEIKVKIEACEDTVSDQGSGSRSQIPLTSAGDEVDEDTHYFSTPLQP
jgi:hypothetical protein